MGRTVRSAISIRNAVAFGFRIRNLTILAPNCSMFRSSPSCTTMTCGLLSGMDVHPSFSRKDIMVYLGCRRTVLYKIMDDLGIEAKPLSWMGKGRQFHPITRRNAKRIIKEYRRRRGAMGQR